MELQAKDLRIGNFLEKSLKSGLGRKNIVQITCEEICRMFNDTGSFNYDPIPLTEEWLLRFGFKVFKRFNETKTWDVAYDITKNNLTINNAYGEWRFTPIWCTDYKSIQYVHQLQNLFFSLCGKELEIINT